MPETMDDSNTPAATQDDKYEGDTICPYTHEVLRAQLKKIKKMLEASSSDEEANAANKSLFEVVRECAPRESPLTSFLANRSDTTNTTISLMSHGGLARHATHTPQDVWNAVGKTEPQQDHVLILRDINSDWCEALCTRYHGSIDRRFLLEHILGLDLHLYPGSLYQAPYVSRSPLKERTNGARIVETGLPARRMQLSEYIREIEFQEIHALWDIAGIKEWLLADPTLRVNYGPRRVLKNLSPSWAKYDDTTNDSTDSDLHAIISREYTMDEDLLAMAAIFDSRAKKARGVHINWWRAPQSGGHGSYAFDSHEAFKRTKQGWTKSNAFVSCCRLSENLCE